MRYHLAWLALAPSLALASIPVPAAPVPAVRTNRDATAATNDVVQTRTEKAASAWQPEPWERYEGIVSRMPFGQPPPEVMNPAAAALPPPPPPPPFASQLALCAINRRPTGVVAVGFMDNSQKPPHGYYLDCGEVEDGFTVVKADYAQESATIEKDGVSVDLRMGKAPTPTPASATPSAAPVAVAIPSPAPAPRTLPGQPRPAFAFSAPGPATWPIPRNLKAIDNALKMGITNESYIERLKQRRDEVVAAQQAAASTGAQASVDKAVEEKASAAYEAMLRRKNLELIRRGSPGLGIPLTPEEDAQLVTEGVLPAQQ